MKNSKKFEIKVAVGVVIENLQGEILLIKKKRGPYTNFWCIPGGKLEPNETLIECVKREVKEELDIEIKNITLLGVEEDFTTYNDKHIHFIFPEFYGVYKRGDIKASDDVSYAKWFSKNSLSELKLSHPTIKLFRKIDYI